MNCSLKFRFILSSRSDLDARLRKAGLPAFLKRSEFVALQTDIGQHVAVEAPDSLVKPPLTPVFHEHFDRSAD